MNDGFQFIDIIFFAMVALFLVLRLRSVLGRRTGNERPPREMPDVYSPRVDKPADNVVELPDRRRAVPVPEGPQDRYLGTPVGAGIGQIRLADPAFSAEGFLQGARAAFEMILGAYAVGDLATLRALLSPEVFANFEQAIEDRRRAGETLESELVAIKSVDIVEAGMDGRTNAVVTVKIVSDQVNATRDASGKVVDGDPNRVTQVTDLWTFSRNARSRDPNWALVETRIPDEE